MPPMIIPPSRPLACAFPEIRKAPNLYPSRIWGKLQIDSNQKLTSYYFKKRPIQKKSRNKKASFQLALTFFTLQRPSLTLPHKTSGNILSFPLHRPPSPHPLLHSLPFRSFLLPPVRLFPRFPAPSSTQDLHY